MKKCGLVLEGGGMRGLYTAGVLDFFIDKNLLLKDITTVSAGGAHAVSYISKQRGRSYKINTKYCGDKRYISLMGLFTRGSVFGMDFVFREIPERLEPFDEEMFQRQRARLTVGLTNVETAKPEYADIRDTREDIDYLIASSSLPMFSQIVNIGGKKYLDGGVTDSIPAAKALNKGADCLVVVLTQNEGYVKKPAGGKALYRRAFKKYPDFARAIENRHVMYNGELAFVKQLEKEKRAVVLRPSMPLDMGRFEKNPDRLKAIYENGYQDAQDNYEKIMALCGGCENVGNWIEKEDGKHD